MKTILIVDNDPDILDLLSSFLSSEAFHVLKADSGNTAIEILKKHLVDLVISDFRMPDGNGMSVLNFVKTLKPTPVFIFISARADLSPEECLAAGARHYFRKPFDLDEVMAAVNAELVELKS